MSKYIKKKNKLINIQMITVYQMIAIYILVVIVTVMITFVVQRTRYEKQIAEINANHKEEVNALCIELRNDYESQIAELEKFYEYGGDVIQIEREAECIAKVIYGYGTPNNQNNSVSDNKSITWCVINRTEHYAYPDTIAEVCEQPKQWIGYSNDNPVLTEYYDLALEELKTWYSGGHRPMNNSYIYLTWSSKEILLRDTFEENRNTNYWRMR